MFAAIKPDVPEPLAGLRDIAPQVPVPWPTWVWWCIGVGTVIVIGLLVWLGYWLSTRKTKGIPPTARQIALRSLEDLRARAPHTEPYEFSVLVSDVLRTYISRHYGLQATQQTSPEFLASISGSERFSSEDRALLADFLERCDLLKFARIEAQSTDNTDLLGAAAAFVHGSRA